MDKARLIKLLRTAANILERDETTLIDGSCDVEGSSANYDGMQYLGVNFDFKVTRQLTPLDFYAKKLDDK